MALKVFSSFLQKIKSPTVAPRSGSHCVSLGFGYQHTSNELHEIQKLDDKFAIVCFSGLERAMECGNEYGYK